MKISLDIIIETRVYNYMINKILENISTTWDISIIMIMLIMEGYG